MLLGILAILFFAITLGPRFFKLENFGYGFFDLGLYTQALTDMKEGFINPYIPTVEKTFFVFKPQPLMIIFWPLSFLVSHPALFLFIDDFAVVGAAAVCANFTWRKTKSSEITVAIFATVLFSPLILNTLHGAAVVELWAQPFLALLLTEHFSRRRPVFMGLWSALLCLVNLNFWIVGVILTPLIVITQQKRWNISRRAEVAIVVFATSLMALVFLHHLQWSIGFNTQYFVSFYSTNFIIWLVCFWFLPLLVPEAILLSLLLLATNLTGFNTDISLLVPVGAISTIVCLERFKQFKPAPLKILSVALISSCVFYNLTSLDPFFHFWDEERWSVSEENKKVLDIVLRVTNLSTVAASEVFTPHLGGRLSLKTFGSVKFTEKEIPEYLLLRNEVFSDPRYKEIDQNLKTGTRLLVRIK